MVWVGLEWEMMLTVVDIELTANVYTGVDVSVQRFGVFKFIGRVRRAYHVKGV